MAYVAVATGVSGLVAVVGPLVAPTLGLAAILASLLTIAWMLLGGRWLWRRGARS